MSAFASPDDGIIDAAARTIGLRETQLAAEASTLRHALETLWETNYSERAGLPEDLERMKRFFDPVATGARLRGAIGKLPPAASDQPIPQKCAIDVGDGRRLVTPEGRCALELLDAHQSDVGVVVLGPEELQAVHLLLTDTYRRWNRHRLEQVVGLLQGDHKPLQVPAAAVVLALLVNRNTAPERALARAPERGEQRTVDDTFFPAVDAFASAVLPSTRRSTEKESLVGGWRLHEAVRRAPHAFAIEPDRVFICPGYEDELLDLIAGELARRQQIDAERLRRGFDDLVQELRRRLPRLDTLGLAFERPLDTQLTGQRLLERFSAIRDQDEPDSTV